MIGTDFTRENKIDIDPALQSSEGVEHEPSNHTNTFKVVSGMKQS